MLMLLAGIVVLVCLALVAYVLTRPSVPKKYPIFRLSDTIEDHYTGAISQLRTVASDSLSLFSSYNEDAFIQLVHTIQGKFDQVLKELDGFDTYWGHFVRFKAQESFVSVCKQYSLARRKQIASAQQFMQDAIPFMALMSGLKRLRQATTNTMIYQLEDDTLEHLAALQHQTADMYHKVDAVNPQHPVTVQYRQYIREFLQGQLQQLESCQQAAQQGATRVASVYAEYADSWSHFNDSHVLDLINDEFSWQIDAYEQAMSELRSQTDYDS